MAVVLCRVHGVSSPVLFACLPGASAMQEPSGPFCRCHLAHAGSAQLEAQQQLEALHCVCAQRRSLYGDFCPCGCLCACQTCLGAFARHPYCHLWGDLWGALGIWSASFGMGHALLCQSGHSCHLFCHEVQKADCSVHGVVSKFTRLPCIQTYAHCALVTARLANQAWKRGVTKDWQHDHQLFLLACCLYFRCVCLDAALGPARQVQAMWNMPYGCQD